MRKSRPHSVRPRLRRSTMNRSTRKRPLAKIKEILAAYDKLTTKAAAKADEPPADKSATESVDDLKAKVLVGTTRRRPRSPRKENVRLRDVDLSAAVALESDAERTGVR